ncbi:DUF6252 domain-containing protein [Rufibacter soli]
MKNLCLLLLLIFPVLLFSCKEEEPEPEKSFSVQKDGVTWSGEPGISIYQDSLSISVWEVNRAISLKVKFAGVGHYGPDTFLGRYNDLVGGDAVTSSYLSTEDQASYLTVTEYNPETGTIKGVFAFKARKTTGSGNGPETLSFTEGKFQGVVSKP